MVWIFMLFLAGMILIIAEFLIPGGVLGAVGALMLIISTIAGVRTFPDAGMYIIVGELFGAGFCILVGIFILTKTKAGKSFALGDAQRVEDGYVNLPSEDALVGAVGNVLAALRPAGTIMVGDRRIDAVSNGVFIAKGTRVRIIEVHGNRVLVEQDEETPDVA